MYIEKDMFAIPTGTLEQLSDISKLLVPQTGDITTPTIVNCSSGCGGNCSGSCASSCSGSCVGNSN